MHSRFSGKYGRGAYELELKLKNGDARVYEFVVFGKIPMQAVKDNGDLESGLTLKPVATIECADVNSKYPMTDMPLGSSRVSESPLGKYRETSDKIFKLVQLLFPGEESP